MDNLDKTMETLRRLPPDQQQAVARIVEVLGLSAGVDLSGNYLPPSENVEKWVTRMALDGKTERTIPFYRQYAERFLRDFPRPTRLDVQGFLSGRLDEGVSKSAVNNMQKSLRSLFGFLKEEGLWPEDPTEGLKSIKVPKTEKYVPPIEDVAKVQAVGWARKADAARMGIVIMLLMETGLRITEAVTVEKPKMDLEARALEVLGKGNKVRKVPLSEPLVAAIRKHLAAYPSDSRFLFPGGGAAGHWGIHNVDKDFKHACLRAKVKPFTPHALRHYFATSMLKNGAKLEVVSRILGHASVGITGDVYRHTDMAEMQDEVDRHGSMSDNRPEK